MVKELRQRLEASRAAERALQQVAAQAEERARGASADAKGKERLALELRARLEVGEASRSQVQEAAEQRTAEAVAEPMRRALERKEVALRSLRGRLERGEQQHASELAEAHQSTARCRKQLEAAAQRAQLELTRRGGTQEEVHARTPDPPPALAQRPNRAPTVPQSRPERTPNAAQNGRGVRRPPPQVKLVVLRVANALEAGAAHPAEERQLAALSQQLLQLSPAELGLAPRADIGAPHLEAGGPSAAGGTGGTAAAALPQRAILSADLQLLETALSEPVDVHGAVTVLLRLVQRRLDAADQIATQRDRSADVEPLLQMSAALHESVRGIREQVQFEQQKTAAALAERELQLLTSLHEGATTPAG